jgi:hypothetical protein
LVSVQCSTAPRLVYRKLFIEPLKITSESVATGPSTALYGVDPPFVSWPALLTIEKALELFASPPHTRPSLAVPQNF